MSWKQQVRSSTLAPIGSKRRYTCRMLVDGDILTPAEATKKFLPSKSRTSFK